MPKRRHGVTLDRLAGDWWIHQMADGHRFSTDDMLCAWAASEQCPRANRLLDLGAGIGSVGLMALYRMPSTATLVMVEALDVSCGLAQRTIAHNGLQARVTLRQGDLRDPDILLETQAFDLITCSPPYIPLGHGVVSANPQRAAARHELRGDVFDYLRVAAKALHPDGCVAIVFAARDPRPVQAIERHGLRLLWTRDVVFRESNPATITLLVAGGPAVSAVGAPRAFSPLIVRNLDGNVTAEMMAVRRQMGGISAA